MSNGSGSEAPHEPSAAEVLPGAADRPIESREADGMGRRAFAEELAREILTAPTDGGYVVALTGAWGSGKTSILNMAAEALTDQAIVIHFNPWMFSGTEALVSSFFREVSTQLGRTRTAAKAVAEKLATYGRLLSPVAAFVGAGSAVGAAADILGKVGEGPSVYEEHESIRRALAQLDQRLVVVVDDVDRLRPKEIRDIVRLVRLVGDFPNTLYLLAFDRRRVEECLGENDIARGRAYLEKIVQVSYDVPTAREVDLTALFLAGLNPILNSIRTGPLHSGDWQNIFAFIIEPLLTTPRDVRRYLQALPMTLRVIGDEIALADVLGLEAIRVLRSDMFDAIVAAGDALGATRTLGLASATNDRLENSPVSALATVDSAFAAAICQWLFPAAGRFFGHSGFGSEWLGTWAEQRRVANPAALRFYLERRLPDGIVRAQLIDDLVDALTDAQLLHASLQTLDPDELFDALQRLSYRLDRIPYYDSADPEDDPAWTALGTLMDQLPRMSPKTTQSNPFGRGLTTGSIAVRLLERIPDRDVRARAIRHALTEATVASARIIVLRILSDRPNIGSGALLPAIVTELEEAERTSLADASAMDLAQDPFVFTIARLLAETDSGLATLMAMIENNEFLMALLRDSTAEGRNQVIGAAAVQVTTTLAWDVLVAWVGEDVLIRRVTELLRARDDGELLLDDAGLSLLNLAADYATGQRPRDIFENLLQTAVGGDQQTRPVRTEAEEQGGDEEPAGDDAEEEGAFDREDEEHGHEQIVDPGAAPADDGSNA